MALSRRLGKVNNAVNQQLKFDRLIPYKDLGQVHKFYVDVSRSRSRYSKIQM